jgi:4-amino-4-deoxy-L-arabinose transferase-like glycosyltransferase
MWDVIRAEVRAALIGAIVAAAATLPGLGAGTLWDNSETTYGEVAREILLLRDPVVMHLNGVPWFVQPPLYFWVAAAFAKLLGTSEFALRLPSALATIVMSGVVGYVVARLASSRAALLAATVLATSLMQAVIGRLAIMDALLDLAVMLAILASFGALRTGRASWWYLAWAALALGTLAKGPVALVVTVLVVGPWLVWERLAGGRLDPPALPHRLGGLALFALLIAPWAFALWHAAGPAAFGELIGHYTVGRYLGTIENQSGPVWYYVPVVVLGFFPWFAFLVPAALAGWREARTRPGSLARLALVWAVVPFCFFSFAQTKLPNYVALELAAFAILVGLWFDRAVEREERRGLVLWAGLVPLTIGAVAFAISAFSSHNRLTPELQAVSGGLLALGLVLFAGSLACALLLVRRQTASFAPFVLAGASAAAMLTLALDEPRVEAFKPIPRFAAIVRRELRPGDAVAIQGVSGSSALLFYTRPEVVSLDASDDPATGPAADLRQLVCSSPRAFVVSARRRRAPDPAYGRERRTLAAENGDVLFLYEGPPCAGAPSPRTAGESAPTLR